MASASYPRIPESNWWKIRDQFKKTMPAAVTTPYLRSLLSLNSEKAASNLLGPLRRLGLIDEEYKPNDRANNWRNDAEYAEVCKDMLAEVYPQELRDLYSGQNLDRQAVADWFSHNARLGEGAASATAQMYVLLNEGVPRSSEAQTKKGEVKPKAAKKTAASKSEQAAPKTVQAPANDSKVSGGEKHKTQDSAKVQHSPTVHMDFQIHISPEAGAEQIDAIFAAMAKHLYGK